MARKDHPPRAICQGGGLLPLRVLTGLSICLASDQDRPQLEEFTEGWRGGWPLRAGSTSPLLQRGLGWRRQGVKIFLIVSARARQRAEEIFFGIFGWVSNPPRRRLGGVY